MSSVPRERVAGTLSLRLALWYAAIFTASAALVVALTYAMLAAALRDRDDEALDALVRRYAAAYATGGIRAVDDAVTTDRLAGRYEPFFLRIARGRHSVLYVAVPTDWQALDLSALDDPSSGVTELPLGGGQAPLDVSTARMPDGTRLQVGKGSAARRDALARFRARVFLILLVVVAAAIGGGIMLTKSALAPLRALTQTIRDILHSGTLDRRVPVAGSADPLDRAAVLFNELLGRLESLITGMRDALDNVAHDLRTPLTRVRSHAEAALAGPRDPDAYRMALESTLEEVERVDQTLTAVMDISDAQTGTMPLARTPVRVQELFEETVSLYEDSAEAKELTVTSEVDPSLVIVADHARMRQVLANLLDNAIKYTPRGGTVRLEARLLSNAVEIRVIDTGVGIPARELPLIWNRLFRGDRSRSERGHGLGLSLVKAIVEAHGGRVSASSEPGAGSVFVVSLPASC
jgi:signal transduction histidine kinase